MNFPICKIKGHPQFDTLPVMKVTHYPLEKRDYKPFAQGIVAVNEERLFVRLWAFETPPEPESRLLCLLCRGEDRLLVTAAPEGITARLNGEPVEPLLCHSFSGDDLQGRYWGQMIELPWDLLGPPMPGTSVRGNLYKCSDGRRPHIGGFFPLVRPEEPRAEENWGEWTIREF